MLLNKLEEFFENFHFWTNTGPGTWTLDPKWHIFGVSYFEQKDLSLGNCASREAVIWHLWPTGGPSKTLLGKFWFFHYFGFFGGPKSKFGRFWPFSPIFGPKKADILKNTKQKKNPTVRFWRTTSGSYMPNNSLSHCTDSHTKELVVISSWKNGPFFYIGISLYFPNMTQLRQITISRHDMIIKFCKKFLKDKSLKFMNQESLKIDLRPPLYP